MEPQPNPHHQTLFIAVSVLIVLFLLAVALYGYISFQGNGEDSFPQPLPASQQDFREFPSSEDVTPPAPEIPEAVTDPVNDLPESNPFETSTNPFEESYKNPFE